MELSCKVEYALVALLELSTYFERGEPLQIKQIAANQGIPDRYLEQVFASLRHAGIVRSQRGNRGGYLLAREPWQITLLDVFNCLEVGSDSKQGRQPEGVDRGIVREVWKEAQQKARTVLQQHTIQDLRQQREARQRLSSMYYI
ncbi:Rrf2 family transcriptional regulator [Oculatella sp. LEGE 06141]|uniref:RrF2 family transcriptional regulator n=1 Tax=Oculatella sp. LEGE 06141 TaxID=1828648 RepID=UPI00187E487B|nr:Rrf2 family transcriptional regulator [Oculatella sp. LEGE 06141]MBE9178874.1 Rrf2 family transcriptional regulator [Oculatella sp. LEGE 06141]